VKKLFLAALSAASFSFAATPAHAIWPSAESQRHMNATTCPELLRAAAYYMGRYYETGASSFMNLYNSYLKKAKAKGCR